MAMIYMVIGVLVLVLVPSARLIGLGLVCYGGYLWYRSVEKKSDDDDDAKKNDDASTDDEPRTDPLALNLRF